VPDEIHIPSLLVILGKFINELEVFFSLFYGWSPRMSRSHAGWDACWWDLDGEQDGFEYRNLRE
jgi:hypothetical protein